MFFNRFPLSVLLVGFFLSFSTDSNRLYLSKADCESYEGIGNCAQCDGRWHRSAACGLLAPMKAGDLDAKAKYIAIIRQEYLNYKNAADKATKAFKDLKGKRVSSKVYEAAKKAAADATEKADQAKADLDQTTTNSPK